MMSPGADYPPPLENGVNSQIFDRPLSQSQRSVCYMQQTYEDDQPEFDELFTLQIVADGRYPLNNLVIDDAGTTHIRIVDDEGNSLGKYFLFKTILRDDQFITAHASAIIYAF